MHGTLFTQCIALWTLHIPYLISSSLSKYPSLKVIVIINPHSGPGIAPWWPNEDYTQEIPRLNAYSNVTLLGYVRATYCRRQLSDVIDDIETYAARSTGDASVGLGVQGIFVDETVNLYTKEKKHYLDNIDARVRGMDGIGGNRMVRSNRLVSNSGTH